MRCNQNMRLLGPCIGVGAALGVALHQLEVWLALGAAIGLLLSLRGRTGTH